MVLLHEHDWRPNSRNIVVHKIKTHELHDTDGVSAIECILNSANVKEGSLIETVRLMSVFWEENYCLLFTHTCEMA